MYVLFIILKITISFLRGEGGRRFPNTFLTIIKIKSFKNFSDIKCNIYFLFILILLNIKASKN